MNILVTGGTGLIGRAVIVELLKGGHAVRALARNAERHAAEFPERVEAFSAELTDASALSAAVRDCRAVVHIAGIIQEQPPENTYEEINVQGTRRLLESASRADKPFLLYVSSLAAERGASDYHKSKLRAEALVRQYAGPWTILRPGNVYGPGDETVSILLKMVRNLPAIPTVEDGTQRFQPVWVDDLAQAMVMTLERSDLHGKTLEIAGAEITCTKDLLGRLEKLTRRTPGRIAVPLALARAATALTDTSAGQAMLAAAGIDAPLDPAKLQLLVEENLLSDPRRNDLIDTFGIKPTTLDEGLAFLADALPEQPPTAGIGALKRASYWADIGASTHSPESLLERIRAHITEIMPIEFAAEPGAPRQANEGATMTGALPARGHFQVRIEQVTARSFTFVTIEGHPLAGAVTFSTQPMATDIRFTVRVISRPSNVVDWLAMRTVGQFAQAQNWRHVVERVITLSEGVAPGGVREAADTPTEDEAHELEAWADNLVQRRRRIGMEAEVRSAEPSTRKPGQRNG
jgi:nucleoside-diphosphate-sugar epimerase